LRSDKTGSVYGPVAAFVNMINDFQVAVVGGNIFEELNDY
jgi:hypothetical protein